MKTTIETARGAGELLKMNKHTNPGRLAFAALTLLAAQAHAVGTTASTTALAIPAGAPLVGQAQSFTATVTGASGTPTGTVQFKDGSTVITACSAVTLASGTASCAYTFTTSGAHSVKAAYSGDATYATSSANKNENVVAAVDSTPVLTSATNPSATNASVALTATVTGASPGVGTPAGTVTFFDGATQIASGALASGTLTKSVKFTTPGAHALTVKYAGDNANSYTASTSTVLTQTVNAPNNSTTVGSTLTNPAQIGRPATLSATVTSSGSGVTPTGTVVFKDGAATTCTATLSAGKGTCTWAFTSQGTHSLTAVYGGDAANNASTSTAFSQPVGLSTTKLTLTPNANPSPAGAAVTLTAAIDGYNVSGTVQFTQDGTNLGTPVTIAGGSASKTSAAILVASGHTFTASWAGNADNTAATGQAVVNVAAATTATSIAASASKGTTSTSFSFAATVSGGAPTGSVTFWDGATSLGTRTLSGGVSAPLATTLASGQHAITATYAGDTTTTPSASQAVAVMVSASGTTDPLPAFTWNYGYDAEGNLTTITDANAALTSSAYDSLSRKTVVTQPLPAAGASAPVIGMQYDLQDQVTRITDPRNLATTYAPDGLGNVLAQSSPDTGSTTRTYYDNGLLHTSKDARNKTKTYSYDAIGRVQSISYNSGTASTFTYDEGAYGAGHLTTIADESGTTHWVLDGLGRVVTKTQTTGPSNKVFSLAYTYGTTGSATGKVQTATYPSGAVVSYGYDALGRVNDIGVTGADGVYTKVLSGLAYTAHDEPLSWVWGTGGVTYQRGYDAYGRLVSYPLGNPNATVAAAKGVVRTLSFDAAGRIVEFSHVPTAVNWDQLFGYDGLGRVTSASMNGGHAYGYAYDASGNRTQSTVDGTTYTQTVSPTSNHYASVQDAQGSGVPVYDAAGNLTSDPGGSYSYSPRGRMNAQTHASGSFSYLYNAFEQRVYKSGPSAVITTGSAYYVYDEDGRLIGEYSASGKANYETIFIGEQPVAALSQPAVGQTTVNFIYADHLNSTRVIARASDHKIVWMWTSNEPFGQSPANVSPNGLANFSFNARFPGQVADAESGWFYNWNRDYNPAQGRYAQSDPIGLAGGINTYLYVGADPLRMFDLRGLDTPAMGPYGCFGDCQYAYGPAGFDTSKPANTIYCDGTKIATIVTNTGSTCPAVVKCAQKHENQHVNDLPPNFCAANSEGVKRTIDWRDDLRQATESRSVRVEEECLEHASHAPDGPCTGECRGTAAHYRDVIIPCADSGKYPNCGQ